MKFDGVCLLTTDVPRLVAFYSTVFDVEADGDAIHSVIRAGGLGLAIWHPEGLEQRIAGYPPHVRRDCYCLMFSVDDLDAEYERIKALNVEFTEQPTTHPWGARSFAFVDPDGNNINVHMVLQHA
jgi:predicted enzyme related to lactoylglutathione lyase